MKRIFQYILFDTFIFIAFFIFIRGIINQNNMEFLQYVNKSVLIISILGIIIGIIQLISKMKKNDIITLVIVLGISILICWQFLVGLFELGNFFYYVLFPPEKIVNKENEKLVGYLYETYDVENIPKLEIDYYEYKNIFLRGNKRIYCEEIENVI